MQYTTMLRTAHIASRCNQLKQTRHREFAFGIS